MPTERPHLMPTLVLCTSRSMAYFADEGDYDPESTEYDHIHEYLVTGFDAAYSKLVIGLRSLGYEVYTEFYTDRLDDEDYTLKIDDHGIEEIQRLVEKFHGEAEAILVKLPEIA